MLSSSNERLNMIIMTEKGLYCFAGDFYIDPKRAVDCAVITHAHSDHARRGSKKYYCEESGAGLLKSRLGQKISLITYPYKRKFQIKNVILSFHSAGHILGSAQIRIELNGEVWVISGDYKRDSDPTCKPFELIGCDVFITEATFGTPSFAWNKNIDFGAEIYNWWMKNSTEGYNSILLAYSLGKAQRVLGLLHPLANKSIFCHPATEELNYYYRKQHVSLAETQCLSTLPEDHLFSGDLLLTPLAFLKNKSKYRLGNYKVAFASGWMSRNAYYYDHGFVMSDHADWNDLLLTIEQTAAKKVYVQHRGHGALVRELNARGIEAYPDSDLFKTSLQIDMFK